VSPHFQMLVQSLVELEPHSNQSFPCPSPTSNKRKTKSSQIKLLNGLRIGYLLLLI